MGRFAQSVFDSGFMTGVVAYEDQYPGQDAAARIVLTLTIEGFQTVQAIVDTGAPWCLFDTDIIAALESMPAAYTPTESLMIRGERYHGTLLRMLVTLRADEGEDVDIEATVFVPQLPPGTPWNYPNFVGLEGFLHRIRFAVDPEENMFYFGSV